MQCQECQQRDATVHVAVVSWRADEMVQHLCETCYPAAQVAREAAEEESRVADLPAPLAPDYVEKMTAADFLKHSAARNRSPGDAFLYRQVQNQLKRSLPAQERLAMELLESAWDAPADPHHTPHLIGLSGCLAGSGATRSREYLDLLEKVLGRSYTKLAQATDPVDRHFGYGFYFAAIKLRQLSPTRFAATLANLKAAADVESERKAQILDTLEKKLVELEQWKERRGAEGARET